MLIVPRFPLRTPATRVYTGLCLLMDRFFVTRPRSLATLTLCWQHTAALLPPLRENMVLLSLLPAGCLPYRSTPAVTAHSCT